MTIKEETKKKRRATYLVCVNDAEYSHVALQFAVKMAQKRAGKLMVLHVTEAAAFQGFGIVADKMRAEQKKEAKKLLRDMTKELDVETQLLHREGVIEEEIVATVEENHDVDMLIVGAAAETSTRSKTLQPLVAQLGNKIMVPMLIVPGNLTEDQMDLLTDRA